MSSFYKRGSKAQRSKSKDLPKGTELIIPLEVFSGEQPSCQLLFQNLWGGIDPEDVDLGVRNKGLEKAFTVASPVFTHQLVFSL